ncbi:MAG: lipoprotein insertase outer membrane protein LolB [Pseudomonadota bacterium]
MSGCTQLSEKLNSADQAINWQQHLTQVSQLSHWYIEGRVGIKTDKQSGSASLFWQQAGEYFEMRIVAPFGRGTYILKGSPTLVQMQGPKNLFLTATTAEELLKQELGWSVDLQGLQYWVRGVPTPDVAHDLQLDNAGRLHFLQQAGFNIDINRYADVGGLQLPDKLQIESANLRLKLLINRWDLSTKIQT